jgi:hypothetical protein
MSMSSPKVVINPPPQNLPPKIVPTQTIEQRIPPMQSQSQMNTNIPQQMAPNAMANKQIFARQNRDDKIINRQNFEKMLLEKLNKEQLQMKNTSYPEIFSFLNNGLETYLKNVLEKLIIVARARNVNLNLYSKLSEKNPMFKIHTYNWDKQVNSAGQASIEFTPYKDFSIVFTKNMKNILGNLESYEELNQCKSKYEKISAYKNKIDEIQAAKDKEKDSKGGNNLTGTKTETTTTVEKKPSVPGTRGRKKNKDQALKNLKQSVQETQRKNEMAKQKKDAQGTLEAFLDNKAAPLRMSRENQSLSRFDNEMASNKNESQQNFETYTKLSEVSKSENPINIDTNDLNLNIFKQYIPSQNAKLKTGMLPRRIILKDLIFYLENERKTPIQNLILHKAILKLNQTSS